MALSALLHRGSAYGATGGGWGDVSEDEFIKWGHGSPPGDGSVPLGAARQPRGSDRDGRRLIVRKVAVVAVPLLVGALGVGFGVTRNSGNSAQPRASVLRTAPPTSSTPTPASAPVTKPTPSVKARPTTDPSLEQLQALTQGDARLAATKLDGRWVAMLSSKTAGIVDPLQTTASGSHSFGWADILREHERLREDPRFGSAVFLIMSTAFGRAVRVKGRPLFVSAVDYGFANAADVRSWCEVTFIELSKAQRDDTCSPAQLSPPS
jgi:hypothetical protein